MGFLTIEPLHWDTDHLEVTCGRVSFATTPPSANQEILKKEMVQLLEESKEQLLVSKIPAEFHHLLCPPGRESIFIDSEITFKYSHPAPSYNLSKDHEITFSKSCDPTPFESLAQEMVYSRYYIDPHIPNLKAKLMWVNSIQNHCLEMGDEIATILINKTPAGIIIIQKKEQGVINLPIVGILSQFQNSGIGTALLQQVLNRYSTDNTILVEASVRNKRAIKFYQHNGFTLDSLTYVTHHWQHCTC